MADSENINKMFSHWTSLKIQFIKTKTEIVAKIIEYLVEKRL